jgi:hypothetical protein
MARAIPSAFWVQRFQKLRPSSSNTTNKSKWLLLVAFLSTAQAAVEKRRYTVIPERLGFSQY